MSTSEIIEIPLAGVESEHCALIVDKGLDKVPGITSHRVELNNHKAIITTREPEAILQSVHAIRDLGYEVETVKQIFPVTGLSCASCAISTETMVKAQKGVVEASVNFASSSLQVEYIPNLINPQQLKTSVQSIGYDLVVEEENTKADALEEMHQQRLQALKRRTIWSIFLSVPLVVIGMFFMDMPYANYIMWALATPVVAIFGRQFFVNAWSRC